MPVMNFAVDQMRSRYFWLILGGGRIFARPLYQAPGILIGAYLLNPGRWDRNLICPACQAPGHPDRNPIEWQNVENADAFL
jgi:hypothetical protein